MLLGLPISGDAVGPRVVPPTWLDDLEECFANIDIAIVWEPYSELAINTRAPILISSVCFQDQAFWMTTTALVYDIYIEAHCPDRVRR